MSERIRRHFTLTLDPALAESVFLWMEGQGMDNMSEAVRGLVRIALAATPEDGTVEMVKARAWNEVRRFAMSRVSMSLDEISQSLRISASMLTTGAEDPRAIAEKYGL